MTDSIGAEADLLCLSNEIATVPGVEPALRRTVSRLAGFRHPAYCELRSVERFGGATLAVVSDAAHGMRLAEILSAPPDRRAPFDLAAALHVVRQTIAAVDALHGHEADVSHGAIGPERLVVTPRGRVLVTDFSLSASLELLRYSHQHYWKSLRVPLPRSAGLARFDQRVDVTQLGVLALALFLGRLLKDDEYSTKLVDVASSFQTMGMGVTGDLEPLRPGLSMWLLRAMQLDPHQSFTTAAEARIELESLLSDDNRSAGAASMDRLLTRFGVAPEPLPQVVMPPPPVVAVPPPPQQVVAPPPQPIKMTEPIKPPEPIRTPEPVRPMETVKPPEPIPVRLAEPVKIEPLAAPPVPFAAPQMPPLSTMSPVMMPPPAPASRSQASPWPRLVIAVVVIAVLSSAGLYAVRRRASASGLAAGMGTLTVQSNPPGVPIDIDGKASGVTPATLSVAAGTHTLLLRAGGEPRVMSIAVAEGAQISQYVEFAKTKPTSGGLVVRTEPAGASVSIDRVPQGKSPVSIAELTPGDHSVVVTSDGVSVEQIVTVEAGTTSSLVVPISARDRGPVSGWIAVNSPVDVQIFESGRLLGTNQTDRIMVPAGEHRLDLVNDALGYRAARTVSVGAGKVETIAVKLPMGSIAVNAVPWAEVWLDGEKAGDTPIGNLQTTIGRHEVVFRHPQLGESRQTVTVTALTPARLSVDMRKK